MDYRSSSVKSLSVLSLHLKNFSHFFRKKLYALVWIPLENRTNFNKPRSLTNILHSLHGQLVMVQDLILALKADNVEACFILSGISFQKLGPKLDIVSVPKCAVCMFPLAKYIPLLNPIMRGRGGVKNYHILGEGWTVE